MRGEYDDIINLPHYEPSRHRRMPMENRAAQFAPFAALTGHEAALDETRRITQRQIELSPDELQTLSRKIAYALSFSEPPSISITCYVPDKRKTGGSYVTLHGTIKKVEQCLNLLTMSDNTEIPLHYITDIDGDIFKDLEFNDLEF